MFNCNDNLFKKKKNQIILSFFRINRSLNILNEDGLLLYQEILVFQENNLKYPSIVVELLRDHFEPKSLKKMAVHSLYHNISIR